MDSKVADLMRTDLKTIRGDSTVREAIDLLAEAHITGLPVIDGRGGLIGVVSSSDVLQAESLASDTKALEGLFDETLVQDIMTPRPQTISPEATLREAAQQLLYLEIHRLFVEREGKVVGVISTSDLVRAMAGAGLT
jgi:CBS domain-containing protein